MQAIHIMYSQLHPVGDTQIISGQVSTLMCQFHFSADWDEYTERYAVFQRMSGAEPYPIDENGMVEFPANLIADGGDILVGAYGQKVVGEKQYRYNGGCISVYIEQGVVRVMSDVTPEQQTAFEEMMVRFQVAVDEIEQIESEIEQAKEDAQQAVEDAQTAIEAVSGAAAIATAAADRADHSSGVANAAAVYANSAAAAANAAADRADSAATEIPSLVQEEVQEATETLSQSFVSFNDEQTVTEEQASTARANINAEKAMTQQEVIDILIETGFIDEEEE